MKLSELKPCAFCKGPLPPIWQLIRISMATLDRNATNQVLGLNQMFNGALGLAELFAPRPNAVIIAGDKEPALWIELHICMNCYLEKLSDLARVAEEQSIQKEKANAHDK